METGLSRLFLEGVRETVPLWGKVLPLLGVGLLAGYFLRWRPFVRWVSRLFSPLTRWAGLPWTVVPALSLMPFSPHAGLCLAAARAKEEEWLLRDVVVFLLLGAFLRGLNALLFYIGAPAVTGLGLFGGAVYVACYAGMTLVPTFAGILLGWSTKGEREPTLVPEKDGLPPSFKTGIVVLIRLYVRIAVVFMGATLAVNLLLHWPRVSHFFAKLGLLVKLLGLPGEAVVVLTTGIASTVGAIGVAAPLLGKGVLTLKDALVALYAGLAGHYLLEFWRHGLPTHVSLFGAGRGAKAALVYYLSLITATLLVVAILCT